MLPEGESPPTSPTVRRASVSTESAASYLSYEVTPAMRQSLPPLLFQYYNLFYPTIFDSWELREAKLLALCASFNADTAVPPPYDFSP